MSIKFKSIALGIKDAYYQWREFAGPRRFEEWSLASKIEAKEQLRSAFGVNAASPSGVDVGSLSEDEIIDIIMKKASHRESIKLIVDSGQIGNCVLDFFKYSENEYKPSDIDLSLPSHFNYLQVQHSPHKLTIKGGIIEFLEIPNKIAEIKIENCCIGNFNLKVGQPDIRFENSWVGKLTLHSGAVHDLTVNGGWICSIKSVPPEEDNPFRGSVTFEDVGLPTSRNRSALYKGSQQYRNLRSHFEKLQNGPMAGLMRAKELASDRESDAGVSWFFNWAYCIASGYGRRPGRAFIWALVFLVLNIMILTGTDGVRVDSLNPSQETWQLEWQGDDFSSQFGRASILTFQTVINPFTIFVAKSTFKFNSLWGTLHTFFFVLLADAAFVFGSLAIRKRLKFS